jgi:hypothetical protein
MHGTEPRNVRIEVIGVTLLAGAMRRRAMRSAYRSSPTRELQRRSRTEMRQLRETIYSVLQADPDDGASDFLSTRQPRSYRED